MRTPPSHGHRLIPARSRLGLAGLLAGLTLFLCVGSGTHALETRDDGWEFLAGKNGIHVWKREIAGQDMPGFRGQTVIKASIDKLLTTMLDSSKHTEWMYACVESSILKMLGPEHAIMYNRVGAPWPVWDRDVIADSRIERFPAQKYAIARFENVPSDLRPVPRHVVRLPLLKGFYKLWELEPGKTKVLYQVEADLGGSIPRWLAIAGAKDMPYTTLDRLRERVEGTK